MPIDMWVMRWQGLESVKINKRLASRQFCVIYDFATTVVTAVAKSQCNVVCLYQLNF